MHLRKRGKGVIGEFFVNTSANLKLDKNKYHLITAPSKYL
ncbi:hypothetical protein MNB_SV-10-1590 [hydrothermal vent metagenome]|uniref:Uncharacterized protein n=1 Tax=hydrothermal vent metagenome TaxID=652676 RepID=A0A1W1CQS5_9ZZZZ